MLDFSGKMLKLLQKNLTATNMQKAKTYSIHENNFFPFDSIEFLIKDQQMIFLCHRFWYENTIWAINFTLYGYMAESNIPKNVWQFVCASFHQTTIFFFSLLSTQHLALIHWMWAFIDEPWIHSLNCTFHQHRMLCMYLYYIWK